MIIQRKRKKKFFDNGGLLFSIYSSLLVVLLKMKTLKIKYDNKKTKGSIMYCLGCNSFHLCLELKHGEFNSKAYWTLYKMYHEDKINTWEEDHKMTLAISKFHKLQKHRNTIDTKQNTICLQYSQILL